MPAHNDPTESLSAPPTLTDTLYQMHDDDLLDLLELAGNIAGQRDILGEDLPGNVISALAAVMAEIGGIRKLTSAQRVKMGLQAAPEGEDRGVKYAYRGIDQIAQAAQPLLGTYGVVIVPNVIERAVADITINSKPWTETLVKVVWTVYGPGGVEDNIRSVTYGLGRDNSDKGDNKAMTTAFKNLLLRILCIGDPRDDTDTAGSPERDADGPPPPSGPLPVNPNTAAKIRTRQTELGLSDSDVEALVMEVTEKRTAVVEEIYSGDEVGALGHAFARRAGELQQATEADQAHEGAEKGDDQVDLLQDGEDG